MGTMARLMPGYDPNWRERLQAAEARQRELLGRAGKLTDDERRELLACRDAVQHARDSRFRTTAEYRDYHFGHIRALLEAEGIHMALPALPDDATREEIDRVLAMVFEAVEVTNSETF